MTEGYQFYVFNGFTLRYDTPQQAVESFKAMTANDKMAYVALGVERDLASDKHARTVDLIVRHSNEEPKISADINGTELASDALVTVNTMSIFKEELNL